MKKIYIVEDSINKMGGVERIVSFLANSFAADGNDVNVISVFKDGDNPFYNYNQNVKITYFYERNKNELNKNLRILYLKNLLKIRRFCKSVEEDSIIIFGRTSIATKFLPFIHKKVKIIVRDAINYLSHSPFEKKIMIKDFPKKVYTFIVSSEENKEGYKKDFNFLNLNMVKIYNPLAIDLTKVEEYSFDNKEILSVGRFTDQKGFENLIKAFSIVVNKYTDWTLKIIGDGELRAVYEDLVESLNIKDKVILAPSSKNIEKEYSNAALFAFSSRNEGYANALVEALACGLPSISYDWLTGVDEIIQDGINGRIVKLTNRFDYLNGLNNSEDVVNLANVICQMIENREVTCKMHQEALKISNSRDAENILIRWKDLIYND